MTFNELFINKKVKDLEGYIKEIKDFLKFSDEEILNDSGKIHIAERLVQLIVDTMLDINQHIIKEQNLKAAEDFQNTFYVLAKSGILPEDFANKVAPVVAVRNRIVHGYESLDKKLFIKNLRKNYSNFDNYVKIIKIYLEKK
jgi:uncharacterized protein YutE (UPF0331/DUF86 family)